MYNVLHEHQDFTATDWYLLSYIYILHLWLCDNMESCHRQKNFKYILFKTTIFNFCEAQGKGRARGGPRKVTQRSFMDGGWWMVVHLSLMLYIKVGCHPPPPPKV